MRASSYTCGELRIVPSLAISRLYRNRVRETRECLTVTFTREPMRRVGTVEGQTFDTHGPRGYTAEVEFA